MRYAFAGDRNISCNILKFLMEKGFKPLALLVSSVDIATHSDELIKISKLDNEYIFKGNDFKLSENIKKLKDMKLDYIFGIHFPYILPKNILEITNVGVVNLHPAFLPFNKGWHTPTWAILDKTPFGATLHFMEEALDKGDIIHQKKIEISPSDTGDSLYQKILILEEEVFAEAFEDLKSLKPKRNKQISSGTSHLKNDLKGIQEIDLSKDVNPLVLIDKLRALTTNRHSEAAFFILNGKKFGVQVNIFEIE